MYYQSKTLEPIGRYERLDMSYRVIGIPKKR
jgi:hypothetical protein